MDGLYIKGRRPTSKKQVKENLELVEIECTSLHGGFSGPATDLPAGKRIYFVGPDPYNSRKFYGSIERTAKGLVVK
jgi:hypothetical protein